MPVVFTPLLRRALERTAADRDDPDETGESQTDETNGVLPDRRVALGALVAGVVAVVVARRLRDRRQSGAADPR